MPTIGAGCEATASPEELEEGVMAGASIDLRGAGSEELPRLEVDGGSGFLIFLGINQRYSPAG